MDELEARLKHDAAQIQAATSPELQARLDASLHAVHAVGPVTDQHPALWNSARDSAQDSTWLVSSLTGLTAVALVILLVNWNRPTEWEQTDSMVENLVNDPGSRLPEDWNVSDNFSLNIRPADLTRSLDEELLNLQSDLEKVRDSVERDVKFTF